MGELTIRIGSEAVAANTWGKVASMDLWPKCPNGKHWICYDEDEPVGFASMKPLTRHEGWWELTATGVLESHRGRGIQRALQRRMAGYIRRQKGKGIVTYTVLHNYPSMMNLLKSGFRFYWPAEPWVGDEVHYFMLALTDEVIQ